MVSSSSSSSYCCVQIVLSSKIQILGFSIQYFFEMLLELLKSNENKIIILGAEVIWSVNRMIEKERVLERKFDRKREEEEEEDGELIMAAAILKKKKKKERRWMRRRKNGRLGW